MIELIPVLELEPSNYPFDEKAALPFIENTFWLIRLTDLTDPAILSHLLHLHMDGHQLNEFSDLFDWNGVLRGGYILKTESHTIEPNCCADIGNIDSWEIAATHRESTWIRVWIGHPSIFCRFNSSLLELTLPTESTEEPQAAFVIDPAALQSAIASARAIVSQFGEHIRPELEKYVATNLIEQALDILLWGKHPE